MARFLKNLSWRRHGVPALKVLMVVALLVWPVIFDNRLHMRIMTTAGLYALMTIGVVIVLGRRASSPSDTSPSTASART